MLRQTDAPWNKLFQATIGKYQEKCTGLGPEYIVELNKNITNKFWNNVFESAYDILKHQQLLTSEQILTTPLWYNKTLSDETFYISQWYSKGIHSISDVLDDNGQFRSLDTMTKSYNLRNINFLHYLRVKSICNYILKETNFQHNNVSRPNIPNHIKILYRSDKGARDFYKYVNKYKKNNHSMKLKWNVDLYLNIDESTWCDIFKVCFNTTNDNSLVWFQLRIIYRILGTNHYLNKIAASSSSLCRKCDNAPETLMHIFTECPITVTLWENIKMYVKEKINC